MSSVIMRICLLMLFYVFWCYVESSDIMSFDVMMLCYWYPIPCFLTVYDIGISLHKLAIFIECIRFCVFNMLWFALVSGSAELVPYFAQRPLSYLVYPGIRDAYTNIDFEISFKPERGDGWYQLFCYHFTLCTLLLFSVY